MRNKCFGVLALSLLIIPAPAMAEDQLRADLSSLPVAAQASIYPQELDPLVQLGELTSSDGQPGDQLGTSVAVCGSTVVVGASELNSSTIGAVYVFIKGTNGWNSMTQTAKLTASDGAPGALFGSSVACDGRTVVVGAPHAAVGSNQYQGEAYVFVRPSGGWVDMTETARLTSADGAGDDYFGYAASISEETVVIGAPQATGQVEAQGKAYIFLQPKSGWKTTSDFNAELTASNAQFDNGLGVSVSISNDTVVAGAAGVNSVTGAAYVYVEPGGGWKTTSTFNAELTASDGNADNAFGGAVSISHNTVAIGAYGNNGFGGAAYVFVEPESGWTNMTETAKLTDPNGQEGNEFGYSLSMSGSTVVVGSSNNPNASAAFVFVKPAAGWTTTSKYQARLSVSDESVFGFSVVVGGGWIVSGSVGNNDFQGAAYVFGR